ncbi:MAG: serine/threonine protein kinase, partial [Limisphaerales bacterium]
MNPPPNPPAADEESLFARALELPAEARAAFLAEACAGDPARQRRLEALLRAVARSPEFLEQPVTEAAPPPASASEGPGARIGRYKLLQQIGEGGCGTVFMAEQEEPVRRRVALKVIKLGMD